MVLSVDCPDWCPQRVWDDASNEALKYVEWLVPTPTDSDAEHVLTVSFARAILAAEQREREACALVAETRSPDDDRLDFQVRQQVATAIRNRSQDQ